MENTFKLEDSGSWGKAFEIAIKKAISARVSKADAKVTKNCTYYGDKRIKADGHFLNVEIKTGCGVLAYDVEDADMEISSLFPKIDYIIYCPEVAANIKAEQQGFVFTRDEFISFLEGYPSMVRSKVSTQGNLNITIQSFKNSKKKSEYVWDACYAQPTVEEWIAEVRA